MLAASQKMSASLSEVISEVVRPIESKLQVRMGPGPVPVPYIVLFAVLRVSRPVAFDFALPEEMFLGSSFRVSKSLKRPPAMV